MKQVYRLRSCSPLHCIGKGFLFSLQQLPADELPHDGRRRDCFYLVRGEGYDVVQELEQPDCFCVGLGCREDPPQKRFGEIFQHRELEDEGRVERHVRIFLEREDVPVLAAADAVPAHDGLFRSHTAHAVVPDDAAQEAVV